MTVNLIIIFVLLNIVNVIIQTVKSIATIKCGKNMASIINAVAYGLYTIVVVYTVCDLPLWFKVAVVAVANLIGVYVVKLIEEKNRKDKLWCIQATIPSEVAEKVNYDLEVNGLSYNYIDIKKYYLFNVYCENKEQSEIATVILDYYNA